MHSYNPADDEPTVYEPDTEYYPPDPDDDMTDADYAAHHAWLATQPQITVTHTCGHAVSYRGAPWLAKTADKPCFECAAQELPPYDDPFGED